MTVQDFSFYQTLGMN